MWHGQARVEPTAAAPRLPPGAEALTQANSAPPSVPTPPQTPCLPAAMSTADSPLLAGTAISNAAPSLPLAAAATPIDAPAAATAAMAMPLSYLDGPLVKDLELTLDELMNDFDALGSGSDAAAACSDSSATTGAIGNWWASAGAGPGLSAASSTTLSAACSPSAASPAADAVTSELDTSFAGMPSVTQDLEAFSGGAAP